MILELFSVSGVYKKYMYYKMYIQDFLDTIIIQLSGMNYTSFMNKIQSHM